MTDRGYLIRPKELQDCFELVRKNNNDWGAVSWNRFATVPVDDPEKRGVVQIRNHCLPKLILDAQRMCRDEYAKAFCDVFIVCEGGMIPCHRPVLMAFSPVLKEMILGYMQEHGIPTTTCPISIVLPDFELKDVTQTLSLFYSGFTHFEPTRMREVCELLDFLKVPKGKYESECRTVTALETKKKKNLVAYEVCDVDSEVESDIIEEGQTHQSRTGDWVNQAESSSEGHRVVGKRKAVEKDLKDPGHASSKRSRTSVEAIDQENTKTQGHDKVQKANKDKKAPAPLDPVIVIEKQPQSKKDESNGARKARNRNRSSGSNSKTGRTRSEKSRHDKDDTSCTKKTAAYDKDEEYTPSTTSTRKPVVKRSGREHSESENSCPESEEFDEEDMEISTARPKKIITRSQKEKQDNEADSDGASTLAKRVKKYVKNRSRSEEEKRSRNSNGSNTNSRYPKRARKGKAVEEIEVDNEEMELDNDVYSINSESVDQEDPDPDQPSTDDLERDFEINGGNRCYYCKKPFSTEEATIRHCSKECGKYLKPFFKYPEKVCLYCGFDGKLLTAIRFIYHVKECYSDPKKNQDTVARASTSKAALDEQGKLPETVTSLSEAETVMPPSEAETVMPPSETKTVTSSRVDTNKIPSVVPKPAKKQQQSNEKDPKTSNSQQQSKKSDSKGANKPQQQSKENEVIPIGFPRVVMEKLHEDLISNIITHVTHGDKIDIPRVPGYSYVRLKVVPKDEIPDFFPDDSPEMNDERIRQLELEQVQTAKESEERYKNKKLQEKRVKEIVARANGTVVPPNVGVDLSGHQDSNDNPGAPNVNTSVDERVPPLVIRRSRLGRRRRQSKAVKRGKILKSFMKCSCRNRHSDIQGVITCLHQRRMKKCTLCCEEVISDAIIAHYNANHHNPANSETLICPVCDISFELNEIENHVLYEHLLPSTRPVRTELVGVPPPPRNETVTSISMEGTAAVTNPTDSEETNALVISATGSTPIAVNGSQEQNSTEIQNVISDTNDPILKIDPDAFQNTLKHVKRVFDTCKQAQTKSTSSNQSGGPAPTVPIHPTATSPSQENQSNSHVEQSAQNTVVALGNILNSEGDSVLKWETIAKSTPETTTSNSVLPSNLVPNPLASALDRPPPVSIESTALSQPENVSNSTNIENPTNPTATVTSGPEIPSNPAPDPTSEPSEKLPTVSIGSITYSQPKDSSQSTASIVMTPQGLAAEGVTVAHTTDAEGINSTATAVNSATAVPQQAQQTPIQNDQWRPGDIHIPLASNNRSGVTTSRIRGQTTVSASLPQVHNPLNSGQRFTQAASTGLRQTTPSASSTQGPLSYGMNGGFLANGIIRNNSMFPPRYGNLAQQMQTFNPVTDISGNTYNLRPEGEYPHPSTAMSFNVSTTQSAPGIMNTQPSLPNVNVFQSNPGIFGRAFSSNAAPPKPYQQCPSCKLKFNTEELMNDHICIEDEY